MALLRLNYTLPQKKHNFSDSMFPGDPGERSVTQGHKPVTGSITKIKNYHMITDLQSLPKEMQLLKSCTSFEEECSFVNRQKAKFNLDFGTN